MKMKKWLKCLLMAMTLIMAVNVGTTATTIPAAAKAKTETVKKGTKFWSGKLQYKVTSLKGKKGTAALIDAKTSVTSVTVPKTVKKGKYTLTVTEIGSNAFKGCKKLKKVVTNTELQKIGKNAFSGCAKLATVDIKSKSLKSVGKDALKGIAKKAVVNVPAGMAVSYEKKLNVPVQAPQTEAPKAPQTEAPKAPQTEAPKAAQTAAPKAPQTEAPKAAQTVAPKAPQTEAPKVPQTEAPKAPQTEAPKASVKAPAAAPKSAPARAETEAPAQTEHVCEFTWVVTKEPYCGYLKNDMTWRDTGSRTGTCSICGKTVKEGLRAEHVFEVKKTVEPTCTEDGATYLVCSVCGYQTVVSLTDENGKARTALGHSMVHHDDPATCTSDGRSYDECSRCGLVQNETVTAKKTGHDFLSGKAVVVKEATCTQDGLREISCAHEGCTEKKEERIQRTGHTLQKEEIPATCISDKKDVFTCTKCGYQETKVEYGTRHGHNMAEEERVKSTATKQGYVKMACTECGYEEKTSLPLLECDHEHYKFVADLGETEGLQASQSDGKIRTARCDDCGTLFYLYNENGAGVWKQWEDVACDGKGHTWSDTPDASRKNSIFCKVCGTVKPVAETPVDPGKTPEENVEKDSRARIVWSAVFKADAAGCVGFELSGGGRSYSATLTAMSGSGLLTVKAPEAHSGYEFEKWICSHCEEIPEELFAKNADGSVDRTTLSVTCDYMDSIFTAVYRKTAGAQAIAAAGTQPVVSMEMPTEIHGEMHIDLSGATGGSQAATESAPEAHEVTEHSDPLDESHAADAGTEMAG